MMIKKWIGACLLGVLLVMSRGALAQKQLDLPVGSMRFLMAEDYSLGVIYWPREARNFSKGLFSNFGVDVGVELSWVDEQGVAWDYKIAESAEHKFSDLETVVMPVPDAFSRVFRYSPPSRIMDGKDWTDVLYGSDQVDATLPSDAMLYSYCNTWVGIDIEAWSYTFVNDEYDDFVILEFVFTNVSGQDRNNVYLGLRGEPSTTSYYPGDLWGNYVGGTYQDYVNGDPNADSLRIFYLYDADEPSTTAEDDRGNPDEIWGHFEKPQFVGYTLLHADTDVNDETNDPSAPHKAGWSQRQLSPDLNNNTPHEIYEFLTGPWDPRNQDLYTINDGLIRTLAPGTHPSDIISTTEQEKTGLFSFGPYNMKAGDDVRVVMAITGGTINERLAIDAGLAFNSGYSGMRPRIPMPYSVPSVDIGEGDILSTEQKDALLDTGLDSLMANASKVYKVWNNASVRKGSGSFNLPMAPASPSLEVTSMPGRIRLQWGDEAEASGDVAGYRVYRNYYHPAEITFPTDTLWTLEADIPGTGTNEWEDENVVRGRNYFYYVTAYNSQGIESSRFMNAGSQGTLEQAASPSRPPDEDWKNKVLVAPNPYHIRGSADTKYAGKKLNFLNTPPYCRIHIYNMMGDKVQTLYHNEGTGDEAWDRQETFSTMEIVSGIYVFVVEELDGPGGNPTGEITSGKFTVVK